MIPAVYAPCLPLTRDYPLRLKSFLPGLCLFAACSYTYAQPTPAPNTDAELCRSTTLDRDVAIKHCTATIETRKANSDLLAQWYVQRGMLWGEKRDYERAIADHNAALKLDPKARHALYYRGVAHANNGDFDLAIADFDAAAQLRGDDPVVFHARGIELAIKGDYKRAIADFDRALQLEPKALGVRFARGRALFYASDFARATTDLEAAFAERPNIYIALWLYLARARGGDVDRGDADALLERDTRRLRGGWPSSLIALYLGRTDIASVNIAANGGDAAQRRDMRCEANYYVAQAHILKNERPRAQALLQEVQRTCPKHLLEYEGTVAELRRLQ
jgi:lipoprotein NlpI